MASLAAVGVVLIGATSAKGAAQDLLAGFGVGSVAMSWFAVHTLFTLRYARLYDSAIEGGVNGATVGHRYRSGERRRWS